MSARWLRCLILAAAAMVVGWIALAAEPADAQVFRPRGRAAAKAAPTAAAKKAPPAAKPAAVSKTPTRAPGPTVHRVGTTKPTRKPRAGKSRHGGDDVVIHDDDDDDVKITDDE
jgi:hypothetical protein